MSPLENERFVPSRIDALVASTVKSVVTHDLVGQDLCIQVTESVKSALISQGAIPRHRIAVQCFVTRDDGQALLVGSKSLWDPETDNYASYTFKREDGIVISVIVFCVYKE